VNYKHEGDIKVVQNKDSLIKVTASTSETNPELEFSNKNEFKSTNSEDKLVGGVQSAYRVNIEETDCCYKFFPFLNSKK
jgi:hypothetical protein